MTITVDRKLVIIPTYNEIENIEKMVRKVFSLKSLFDLLIVDDVVTTGATADACSRALLTAGAGKVTVLALARAVG